MAYPGRAGWLIKPWSALVRRGIGVSTMGGVEATQAIEAHKLDHFVEMFADKIPKTHGAPVRVEMAS